MNPIGLVLLICIAAIISQGSRRFAALGLLAGVLFLPQSVNVSLAGVNVFGMRMLEVVAATRIISRGEIKFLRSTSLDKAFFFFFCYLTLIFVIRSDEGVFYQVGLAIDAIICYISFRVLLQNVQDILWLLRAFLWLLVPFAGLVLIESLTLQNPFSIMGGVAYGADWLRDGRLRCQGSFQHCSLLGTLGAGFLSLYIALAVSKSDRKAGILGILLCISIVWLSNSGGPISCVANVVFCWALWKYRARLTLVKFGIAAVLVASMTVMEASIFYLPAKVSSITGGDGWHRSYLMEVSFRDLHKWWLFGMPLSETADWFPYLNYGTGFADITNQFLSYGLASGLPAMLLFFYLLLTAKRHVGVILSSNSDKFGSGEAKKAQYIAWGLGSLLVMHIANWFGIIYFDQSYVIWYLHLAMIGSLSQYSSEQMGLRGA